MMYIVENIAQKSGGGIFLAGSSFYGGINSLNMNRSTISSALFSSCCRLHFPFELHNFLIL